jgi:hypothetical protein
LLLVAAVVVPVVQAKLITKQRAAKEVALPVKPELALLSQELAAEAAHKLPAETVAHLGVVVNQEPLEASAKVVMAVSLRLLLAAEAEAVILAAEAAEATTAVQAPMAAEAAAVARASTQLAELVHKAFKPAMAKS